MLLKKNDTIVAIATAKGLSAINIIRISGPDALELLKSSFTPQKNNSIKARSIYHGWIYDQHKNPIDEVITFYMKAPHSYTAEDVVEIQTHGGFTIAQTMLTILMEKGARLAEAGEFTQRAFFNGRIDLTKAEAVFNLIQSKQVASSSIAAAQLKGKLYEKIITLKNEITELLALLNANIDFIEEDISFIEQMQMKQRLEKIEHQMIAMLKTADIGAKMLDGYKVVLAGEPNVGKSSIMNQILKTKRSIVTEIAGTTRDYIEEFISIDNIPMHLIDTAGLREAQDVIEQEGIQRSKDLIKQADLIVYIIDSTKKIDYQKIEEYAENNTLFVFNKKDLNKLDDLQIKHAIHICAHKSDDIEHLKTTLIERLIGSKELELSDVFITNLRQKQAMEKALSHLQNCLKILTDDLGEEFLSVDLHLVLNALLDIIGEITSEDILDQIFSNFCIGK